MSPVSSSLYNLVPGVTVVITLSRNSIISLPPPSLLTCVDVHGAVAGHDAVRGQVVAHDLVPGQGDGDVSRGTTLSRDNF